MERRLTTRVVGTGDAPVVLLHGFLGSGKNLRTLAQRWAERAPDRRFVIVDLPGHGTSPAPDELSLDGMAKQVLATVQGEAGGVPTAWVGHSLGGRVALAASAHLPDDATVTLLDIAPGPVSSADSHSRRVLDVLLRAPDRAPDRRTLRTALIDGGLSAATADWLMMNVIDERGSFTWSFDRALLDRLHERVNAEDLWPLAEALGPRLRCIRAGRSAYVSAADLARLEQAGCWTRTMKDAGHDLHVDALDELVALLT